MTYLAESVTSGAEPWQWVEIELDRCTLSHGVAPCTATGAPCFNGIATCQDADNFAPAPYWVRMCEARATIPLQFPFDEAGAPFFWPLLNRVQHSPVKVDPGKSIGVRAEVRVVLSDAPHHDRYIDPYVDQRPYEPLLNGSFLQKLRARFPFSLGRRLRWYEGFLIAENDPEAQSILRYGGLQRSGHVLVYRIGNGTLERQGSVETYSAKSNEVAEQTTLAMFVRRDYVIERIEGPDRRGNVTIVAKDPLKLADDDRAQDPLPSTGVLAADLDEEAEPAFLDIVTTDPDQYPAGGGHVFIGGEGFSYSARVPAGPANTHRLFGLSRSLPDEYVTDRKSHSAGDLVQVASYRKGTAIEIVRDLLLERVPGFRPEWINFADWQAEYETWLGGLRIRRMIHEPEGVHKLLDEIVGQTLTWSFWWDEAAGRVQYRALRPVDITETVIDVNDDSHMVADTVERRDDPDALINEVQVLYGQRDPTKRRDEAENYRRGQVDIAVDSQSETGDNVRRVQRIFARWHGAENAARVRQFAKRTLTSQSTVPVRIEFEMALKDRPELADFLDMTSIWVVNEFGLPRKIRLRVVRATMRDDTIRYEAREDFFRTKFGRWAPVDLEGLLWADATQEQRGRYMFWAGPDGKHSDGSDGTAWL